MKFTKTICWICLAVVIAMVVVIFVSGITLWNLIPAFFAFMLFFCKLVSLYIAKYNQASSKLLDKISIFMLAGWVISRVTLIIFGIR